MKITCPKCHSTYKVDLPDPSQAGIDVQCGNCLYIFLFSPDSVKTQDTGLPEDRLSAPILPPQKDEDQEVFDSKKQPSPSLESDRETAEELQLEPLEDDSEPIEIIIEDEAPEDSLEEVALDDIWDQAMQEGARETGKLKEKPPVPPSEKPMAKTAAEEPPEESPPPAVKKSKPLPSLEERQREIDQIIADHRATTPVEKPTAEESQPTQEDPQQEKTQEEIDLEEQVTIDEEETMPSWEEAFADQTEVEAGWRKAQEEDRIHEEQQLADALGEEYVPSEATAGETPAPEVQENKQNLVDQLFAEVRSQQETPEEPEGITQDEPLNIPDDKVPSSEIQETHVDQHTIPGGIDLMTDLDDLNMKQLVTEAFREESESQENAETSAPENPFVESEEAQESVLMMESSAETPQEEEIPPLDTIPELEMESPVTEAAEETPEPVEDIIEGDFEIEPEPILETAESPVASEPDIIEPLEMESELTTEPEESTPSAEQPATSQESLVKESEELWTDLLPEHHGEEPPVDEEAPVAFSEEEEEGSFRGNDFWDQVLEKDSQEPPTAEVDQPPVASAPTIQDEDERETLTDEELWKQAFPGEEEPQPTAPQYSGRAEEDSQAKVAPLVVGTNVKPAEPSEGSPEYDDAAYAEYDDDDEFEFQRRKRKLGPFTIPHGRRGDLVIGGVMMVFLLLGGSIYFTLQTFAPGELTDMETAKTEVPEGLSPREVPLDELAGDLTSPQPEKTPPVDKPGDKGEAILSDPSKILEESPEEKGILKDLAESQILKDTGKTQTAKIDQSALEALSGHSVTMSTIMPVAYNSTDIRVLSFSVEMQLSDAQSAKRVRESLPVYEEIINQTVEDFLQRKFYNDILYVKEKLQKRLQTAMNNSLQNGRVRKTKFVDYAIQ